tara:strand:- start:890 stop:1501 length:612 start_codon:yes stop_codon:yes gene_type:complete
MYGINLDLSNRCTNRCPGCARDKFKHVPGSDLTESDMEKISNFFQAITFCGQVSDPVLHPNFHNLLQICLRKNRRVVIHTAVAARPKMWWTKSFIMSRGKNIEWVFAIDGLPQDSHKYRVNQDGEKLFDIMLKCASFNVPTTWQYIVFNYNQKDVEQCKQIAKDHNIKFMQIDSGRWGTDALKSLQPDDNYSNVDGVSVRKYV